MTKVAVVDAEVVEDIVRRLERIETAVAQIRQGSPVDEYMSEAEVSRVTGYKQSSLRQFRVRGYPTLRFVRGGRGEVRYLRADVDALMRSRLRSSSSDVVEGDRPGAAKAAKEA